MQTGMQADVYQYNVINTTKIIYNDNILSNMTSIAQQVWKAIEQDIVVRRALEKKIVSLKNLAAYLIKAHQLEGTADGVISAIRRYREAAPLEKKYEHAREVIKSSEAVKITTNIAELVLEKNHETQDLLYKALQEIKYDKGELLLVIQGEESIKLMINEKNVGKLEQLFSKHLVVTQTGIAQINIHLSKQAVATPGIISVFSTELMMHDINMVETMSCVPEMLFFIEQKDVVRAYEVINGLTQ